VTLSAEVLLEPAIAHAKLALTKMVSVLCELFERSPQRELHVGLGQLEHASLGAQ
jgi:hypothetical protein